MSELLLAYEDFLKIEKQASANTVSSYLRDVNQFATAMDGRGVDLTQVVARDVEDYANSLVKRGSPLPLSPGRWPPSSPFTPA